jgi:hypothetical protein
MPEGNRVGVNHVIAIVVYGELTLMSQIRGLGDPCSHLVLGVFLYKDRNGVATVVIDSHSAGG